MQHLILQLTLILEFAIFASVVFMHLVKKNATTIHLYTLQSAATAALLLIAALRHLSPMLLLAVTATVIVKVCLTPYFLARLIDTHQLKFSTSTYLNSPLTLLILAGFVAFAHSPFFAPLVALSQGNPTLVLISIATLLGSLFLLINRKGAISQILGIISIENSIVTFALFSGLEQSPALELGIAFDMLIWVLVAALFTSMLYRQFGTIDVTTMRKLTDSPQ